MFPFSHQVEHIEVQSSHLAEYFEHEHEIKQDQHTGAPRGPSGPGFPLGPTGPYRIQLRENEMD